MTKIVRTVTIVFILMSFISCLDFTIKIDHSRFPFKWASVNLSTEDIRIVRKSLESWNTHFKIRVFEESNINTAFWKVERVYAHEYIDNHLVAAKTDYTDFTVKIYDEWETRPEIGKINIIAHEGGHMVGIGHDPRPDCLMYGIEIPSDLFKIKNWCF